MAVKWLERGGYGGYVADKIGQTLTANAPGQAHTAATQGPLHKAKLRQEPALFPRFRGHTQPDRTQTFNSNYQDEGRTYNMGFAAMLSDEYILICLLLSASAPANRTLLNKSDATQQKCMPSASVILLGCCSGWTFFKFLHSSKPCLWQC